MKKLLQSKMRLLMKRRLPLKLLDDSRLERTPQTGAARRFILDTRRCSRFEAAGGIECRRLPTCSKTDTGRKSPCILRGEVLIRIVSQPEKPPRPIVIGAETPRCDRSRIAQSALAQEVQGHVRPAVRNMHVQVPVALLGVKAIIRDDENRITDPALPLVAGAQ